MRNLRSVAIDLNPYADSGLLRMVGARAEARNANEHLLSIRSAGTAPVRSGDAPNSTEAMANLRAICRRLDPDRYELEIIDILDRPLRALEDGGLVTPTLTRSSSPPVSIVGILSDHEKVRRVLGLEQENREVREQGSGGAGQ